MQLLKHALVLVLLLLPLAAPAPLRAGPFAGGSSFADPAFLAT